MRVSPDVVHLVEQRGGFIRATDRARRIGQLATASYCLQRHTLDEVLEVATRADVTRWREVEEALRAT